MLNINIHEAKAKLSAYARMAESGKKSCPKRAFLFPFAPQPERRKSPRSDREVVVFRLHRLGRWE